MTLEQWKKQAAERFAGRFNIAGGFRLIRHDTRTDTKGRPGKLSEAPRPIAAPTVGAVPSPNRKGNPMQKWDWMTCCFTAYCLIAVLMIRVGWDARAKRRADR